MNFLKHKNTNLFQEFVMVFLRKKVDVSRGDDADQFAAHFARLCDRNTREAMSHFGLKHIPNCMARTHHNWVCDETLLKPLETKRNQTPLIFFIFLFVLAKQKTQRQTKHHPQDKQQ